MEYWQRLKGLREDNDKSQREIAEILGTEQSYYAKYENGKRPLPIDRLKTLCEYRRIKIPPFRREEGRGQTWN